MNPVKSLVASRSTRVLYSPEGAHSAESGIFRVVMNAVPGLRSAARRASRATGAGLRTDAAMLFGLLALLCVIVAPPATAGSPSLTGRWALDADRSDDPRKALKGLRLMREAKLDDKPESRGGVGTDSRYYAQRELLEKKRIEGAVADVGPIQRVLDATHLDIEDGGTAVTLRYDEGWSRSLTPTEGGPVYSAKGVEYKEDALGLELSYRRDGRLFIETMLRPRGRMLEELQVDSSGRVLTVKTTIDNPDWIIEAHIKRVYTLGAAD